MTGYSSTSDAARHAANGLIKELSDLHRKATTAIDVYERRLEEIERAEKLGLPDVPVAAGKKRVYTDAQEEALICEPYWEHWGVEGKALSIRRIARKLGCGTGTVQQALRRYAVRHPQKILKIKRAREATAGKQKTYATGNAATQFPHQQPAQRTYRAPAPLKPDTTWDDDIPKDTPELRAARKAERERQATEAAPQKRKLEDMAFDDAELYGDES